MPQMIILKLTKEQQQAIKPFLAMNDEAEKAGRPGLIIAQVFEDHMTAGWVGHEAAKKFTVPNQVIGSAYDRTEFGGTPQQLKPKLEKRAVPARKSLIRPRT